MRRHLIAPLRWRLCHWQTHTSTIGWDGFPPSLLSDSGTVAAFDIPSHTLQSQQRAKTRENLPSGAAKQHCSDRHDQRFFCHRRLEKVSRLHRIAQYSYISISTQPFPIKVEALNITKWNRSVNFLLDFNSISKFHRTICTITIQP